MARHGVNAMGMEAGIERAGGITGAQHPGGLGADLHARAYKGLGADPGIGADTYRFCVERSAKV
jgi:hypothetical protein